MAYASQSLGSMPFGGLSGGAGNPVPDTVEATLTINAPLVRIYSAGGTLAGLLTINAPAPVVTPSPSPTLSLTITANAIINTVSPQTLELNASPLQPSIDAIGELSTQILSGSIPVPIPLVDAIQTTVSATVSTNESTPTPTATPTTVLGSITTNAPVIGTTIGGLTQQLAGTILTPVPRIYSLPATFPVTINVLTPIVAVVNEPSEEQLAIDTESPTPTIQATPAEIPIVAAIGQVTPIIIYPGTTLNATLTINAPIPVVSKRTYLAPIEMGYPVPNNNLAVTIVRYIYDPIVTGGCPQCGTFMYEGGRQIPGTVVKRGRNFDIDKGRREDRYVRCHRCGFILHKDRHVSQTDGSRTGWGMKYTEVEAGSE